MNRYPNLNEAEMQDLHTTLGEYLEDEYAKIQKGERHRPASGTDRVAKAIIFMTKDLDMPKGMIRTDSVE